MTQYERLLRGTLAVFLFVTFAALPVKAQSPETPAPRTIEELQSAVQHILDKHKVPGAGIALVSRNDVIWSGGIGKADVAANRRVAADTVFRVGSVSKTFVAMSLLKLQEQGKLSLLDRVRDVAPEISIENPWESSEPLRIVHLLEHTSGFDDMEPAEMFNLADPADISLREVIQRFPNPQRVRWRPGTRFSYSNPGYALSGYIVERVSGRGFEAYVKDELLLPLGMKNSDFRLAGINPILLAQGYNRHQQPSGYRNIYLRPAGDLKSSPADMAQLVRMFLKRGAVNEEHLLSPGSIERMERVETTEAARAGLKKGYGLGMFAAVRAGQAWYGHDGGIPGFLSSFQYAPDDGVGYVVLLNGFSIETMNDLKDLLSKYLLRGRPTRPFPKIELSERELRHFVGYYEKTNPRIQKLHIMDALAGGRLVVLRNKRLEIGPIFGKRQVLVPVSQNQFRLEDEPEGSWIFFTGGDGRRRLASTAFYGAELPAWHAFGRFILLMAAASLMALFVIAALIWIPVQLARRKANHIAAMPALATLFAALCLVGVVILLGPVLGSFEAIGTRNVVTLSLFFLSWLWPIASLISLVLTLWYVLRAKTMMLRMLTVLGSGACFGLTVYFLSWGAFGFKFF